MCTNVNQIPYPDREAVCASRNDDSVTQFVDEDTFIEICDTMFTDDICNEWAMACINDLPDNDYICNTLEEANPNVHNLYEAEGYSLWEFCEDNRYYENFDSASWCADNQEYCFFTDEMTGDMYIDPTTLCEGSFPPGTFEGSNIMDLC